MFILIFAYFIGFSSPEEYCERFDDEQPYDGGWSDDKVPRVAVIGAGIAGTSFAYYLRRAVPRLHVTVFEADSLVGGRMYNTSIVDEGVSVPIETGAGIWVEANANVERFIADRRLAKVSKKTPELRTHGATGMYTGDSRLGVFSSELAFTGGSYAVTTLARLLWRYGLAPLAARAIYEPVLSRFLALYANCSAPADVSPAALLRRLALESEARVAFDRRLQAAGVAQAYIDELASIASRVNYNQEETELSAFAGLVTLVASGRTAYQMQQGNRQLCVEFLKVSVVIVRVCVNMFLSRRLEISICDSILVCAM